VESLEESDKYGKYFGAVFRLMNPSGKGGGRVIALWTKDSGHWRIVSYEIDPGVQELAEVPDMRPPLNVTNQRMRGDPEFLAAADNFGILWGTGEIDQALAYFTAESLGCVGLYLRDEELPPGEDAARNRLRQGLENVYQAFSQAVDITKLQQPVEFVHPDIRMIDHPKSDRYSLAGLPDHMGEAYGCKVTLDETTWEAPVNKRYGTYYAAAVQFNLVGEDPAILYLLWSKVDNAWRITSFMTIVP
jgi:hypothetical protein